MQSTKHISTSMPGAVRSHRQVTSNSPPIIGTPGKSLQEFEMEYVYGLNSSARTYEVYSTTNEINYGYDLVVKDRQTGALIREESFRDDLSGLTMVAGAMLDRDEQLAKRVRSRFNLLTRRARR